MSASSAPNNMRCHILETARPILGRKGFSAVGLNEILTAASVPKGSFYHYFASKEAFGEALLEQYFAAYFARIDALFAAQDTNAAERFMAYWIGWRDRHIEEDSHEHCLVVKLGAEVCDLSERMRLILEDGTAALVDRLSRCLAAGQKDGSLSVMADPTSLAMALYQLWLGATLYAKFTRNRRPFDEAMATTRQMLQLS